MSTFYDKIIEQFLLRLTIDKYDDKLIISIPYTDTYLIYEKVNDIYYMHDGGVTYMYDYDRYIRISKNIALPFVRNERTRIKFSLTENRYRELYCEVQNYDELPSLIFKFFDF